MTNQESKEFYKTVKIMKCGDCEFIVDATKECNKRKVYRCGAGRNIGYKVGLKSECHLPHQRYYKKALENTDG